jgi:outer membrane protein TolC
MLAVFLSGCATYLPQPLPATTDLRSEVAQLRVASIDLPLPDLRSHPFNLDRPLDMDEVATLAVANNPDLKGFRVRIGIAQAQAFQAGLLPNPALTFDYGFLISGPDVANSIAAGIAQSIQSLLTLSVRKAGAAANTRDVVLSALWQEWQVVSQARTFFVRAVSLDRQLQLLRRNQHLARERYDESNALMLKGDEVLPTVSTNLVALNVVSTLVDATARTELQNRHDLNALLGLAPEVKLHLAGFGPVPRLDAAYILPRLNDLVARRPDVLALRQGYEAQEDKVRQAIIEQFPKLSIGSNGARDTALNVTQSLSVALTLPLFDQNQGHIAIEQATRERLNTEYQARLDAAYGATARLISEIKLSEQQYQANRQSAVKLREAAIAIQKAYAEKNVDVRTYYDIRLSLLARELAIVKLEQAIWEQRVKLQTLIGSALPERHAYQTSGPT